MHDNPTSITEIKHKLLQFDTVPDSRGNLCIIEPSTGLPFSIGRVYYLFDVPSGSERGGHAHFNLQQLLIPISGSFSVKVVSENITKEYQLNDPSTALYLGPGVWRELLKFSSNSVCLVLASDPFDEKDYIRSRADFNEYMVSKK